MTIQEFLEDVEKMGIPVETELCVDGPEKMPFISFAYAKPMNGEERGTLMLQTKDDLDLSLYISELFEDAVKNKKDFMEIFKELRKDGITYDDFVMNCGDSDLWGLAKKYFSVLDLIELKKELSSPEDSIGYTLPGGKYHLFISVDETDEKVYVIEPNRVVDGAHEPFLGENYLASFSSTEDFIKGCIWAIEVCEKDNKERVQNREIEKITLKDFLNHFDFDYEISRPDDYGERAHRNALVEEGALCEENIDKIMVRLVDLQGANLGGIEGERFSISDELASGIVDRLDVYVNDYVISNFEETLEEMKIDVSSMNLDEMIKKVEMVGIEYEVPYEIAKYVVCPELIDISEVWEKVNGKGSLDKQIQNAVSETKGNVSEKDKEAEIGR